MMKKVLVLMLVLGITSIANAGYVDLLIVSLNQEPIEPGITEITIGPSDTIDFDIVWYQDPAWSLFGLSAEIYILPESEGTGEFDISDLTWPVGVWDGTISGVEFDNGNIDVWTSAAVMGLPGLGIDVPAVVIDHFLFHCTGLGDVVIGMREDGTLPTGASVMTDGAQLIPIEGFSAPIIIHQIPEPMTIALLGLGSLVLLRRRK